MRCESVITGKKGKLKIGCFIGNVTLLNISVTASRELIMHCNCPEDVQKELNHIIDLLCFENRQTKSFYQYKIICYSTFCTDGIVINVFLRAPFFAKSGFVWLLLSLPRIVGRLIGTLDQFRSSREVMSSRVLLRGG